MKIWRYITGFALTISITSVQPARACPSDLDLSFGSDGVAARLAPNRKAYFGTPFVQTNGAILVPGSIDGHPMVMRYHANGTLDQLFGQDGVATVIVPDSYRGSVSHIDVQSAGHIVASGVVSIFDGEIATSTPLLVRFDSTGELDPTFGDGGIVLLPTATGADAWMTGVVVRSDGIIVAPGRLRYTPDDGLPRSSVYFFRADGNLNPGFGVGGVVALAGPPPTAVTGIVLLDDDAVVVSGVVDDVGDTLIAKLSADGTPDPAFGDAGVRITRTKRYEEAWNIGVDGLGRILVGGDAGSTPLPDRNSIFVRRYLANGKLDRSYGRRGKASIAFASPIAAFGFAVTEDGRTLVAAYHVNWNATGRRGGVVARFGGDGSPDQTFGRHGVLRLSTAPVTRLHTISLQADGKPLVAGESYLTPQSGFSPLLLRLEGGTWDGTEQCVAGCGNGIVKAPEQCDDGNASNDDGCSAACAVE